MKIISLNVNNFGGLHDKPLLKKYQSGPLTDWTSWNTAVDSWRLKYANKICDNVAKIVSLIKNYDIIFLHEVDTNCPSWFQLHELMKESYNWEPANGFIKSSYAKGRQSISCVFIKKEFSYKHKTVPNFSKKQRNVELVVGQISILGIHAPYNIDYWNSLINHVRGKENYLILGDLNVFKPGTDRKAKFDELLQLGLKDLWIEQGEDILTPTANTNCRIDYALSTPSLLLNGIKETIIDSIRQTNNTDHSAISVSI